MHGKKLAVGQIQISKKVNGSSLLLLLTSADTPWATVFLTMSLMLASTLFVGRHSVTLATVEIKTTSQLVAVIFKPFDFSFFSFEINLRLLSLPLLLVSRFFA